MKKLLVVSFCLLGLSLTTQAFADPRLELWASYNVNTMNCNSNNLETCGAQYVVVDANDLPPWFEQYNLLTDLCESQAQTGYTPFHRDGSNNDSVSSSTWYILSTGSACRTGLTDQNATTSNGSAGWVDGGYYPNGANTMVGKPGYSGCSALGGTQDASDNCFCPAGQSVDPVLGCVDEDTDECEIPTGSVYQVNFVTENHPESICVNNCGASRIAHAIRLKTGSNWNVHYEGSGDACVGGETGIDGSNATITPPGPVCSSHRGIEYCIDLANNRILKDGSVAWDFDNGDYYDGVCAISSSATFVCDGDATLPGTDNSDPYVDIAVDTDNDPQPEIVFIPDTSSGIARITPGTAVDTTGDGSADSVAVDSNGDGVTDSLGADANGDSVPDIDDPSTPDVDESAPPGDTTTTPGGNTGGGGNTNDNSTGECIDNLNTPWNECDTDGDGEGGEDGQCTDDPNTPWNDCSIGVDLDGCDSQPEVTGDPLQAAAIYLAWQDACSAYVPPEQLNNGESLENSRPEDDGSFLTDSVDLPTALDQDGFISSGTSYPPIEFSVMGQSHQIDLHELEGLLGIAGNLLVIMSLLWAGRLLTQG